ncbi:MAG: FliM/FliN family flagellar motor C-terminal domain-containing protein [Polyangiaceae bacterium]
MTDATRARLKDVARPFPWQTFDAISAEDAAATRALNRWGNVSSSLKSLGEALSSVIQARVAVSARRVRSTARADLVGEEGVAVVLCPIGVTKLERSALVEVEPALAATLVARSLRRAGPRVVARGISASPLAGAIAAISVAAARRVRDTGVLRVIAAGPARALERDLASACGELIDVSLTVLVNDDAYAARVLVPRTAVFAARGPSWTRAALAALGDAPISVPIVAAASRSTVAEVGSIRRGDAWLPGSWPLRLASDGRLTGPVLLAAPLDEVGIGAVLGDDGHLVLRGSTEPLAWTPGSRNGPEERVVSEGESERDALVDAVGEVPVVVRVEIGAAEMRAREWASLAPGDVVSLGRKVGDAVSLRVGGVTVARGELVVLDGEVAVRVLGRTDGGTLGPHSGGKGP